ncbi:ferredoxin [Rhodococcus ruber BKS 20-38]|uniref:Ferredoxin n=1 Tax=Rhodococcus ruber BKS 20-38 TaxID=1278076 RepID=M3A1R5_9NOCA|nr:ferredoxin [Rhodococcus ruber BKS 20-38]
MVRAEETIVDALRRHGLRTRYKCRRGGCGACRATLVVGEVTYPIPVSGTVVDGPRPRPDVRNCLPCRAAPATDLVIELGPRDRIVDIFAGLGTAPPNTPGNTEKSPTHLRERSSHVRDAPGIRPHQRHRSG